MLNLLGASGAARPGRHICVCAFDANPTPIGGGWFANAMTEGHHGRVKSAPPAPPHHSWPGEVDRIAGWPFQGPSSLANDVN